MKRVVFSIVLALFVHVVFGFIASNSLYCEGNSVLYKPHDRKKPIQLYIYGAELDYFGHLFDDCFCDCGKPSDVIYICEKHMYSFCLKHAPRNEDKVNELLIKG